MKAICPANPKHNRFITTAHEQHEWIVDETGDFVEDLGCLEVTADPDPRNCWSCQICGEEAIVEE